MNDDGLVRHSENGKIMLEVSNSSEFADLLVDLVGCEGGPLAGVFRRSGELVHTPRIGEDGYVEEEGVDLGPAQVKMYSVTQLRALVWRKFACYERHQNRKTGSEWFEDALPPYDGVQMAYESCREEGSGSGLRELVSVTHTPTLRPDGTVIDQPGYDQSTGILYLPDAGLVVPPVPDKPKVKEIKAAVALFLSLTAQFPFVHPDHRATWCGLAMTPLMRAMLKPPYPWGVVTAPNPGSGKGFLVGMIRNLHGGVVRGELSREREEFRKQITSTLIDTTAPVIVWDNVAGVVRSSELEALLTTSTWSDRYLGHNRQVTAVNDRLWLATGNNASIGGDLARRTMFMVIDPKMPNPERRTGFKIHPPSYVPKHRGELLAAMLTIIRGWVQAGAPTEITRSDDYAIWQGALTGMLEWAKIPGRFGGAAEGSAEPSEDDREWAGWLETLYDAYQGRPFTVAEVTEALGRGTMPIDNIPNRERGLPRIDPTTMPSSLPDKFSQARYGRDAGFRTSLGRWFLNRDGRYADGWKCERAGDESHSKRPMWKVSPP